MTDITEELYKERLQSKDIKWLEKLRDDCLDTARIINEVLTEKEMQQ